MKWFASLAALIGLASSALAEDLLFVSSLLGEEATEAKSLGFTTKVVNEVQWKAMKTADFASFKAIIIGDEFGSSDVTLLQVLIDTKNVWGPAVTGNIIVHGTDQSNHDKTVLIDNSIKFAASGKTPQGIQTTGLYISLSQYYDQVAVANVDVLSYFGTFEVRGQLSCYNKVHIVASSPAIDTLTDDYLSNWSCSVHEAFSAYPNTGINGFQAIAIADGVVAPGTQSYGDGHSGLPYIITRGATPAGCGDGHWDPALFEECDDGNTVDGDGCSKSCKCESGKANGDGTCAPKNGTIPSGTGSKIPSGTGSRKPSGTGIGKPSGYANSTTFRYTSMPRYPTTTPPYPITTSSPSGPSMSCIGVEIIVSVTVTELCSTIAPGSTVTSTVTGACSTYQQPIYDTQIATMPCYICALKSQGISTNGFITATSTYCNGCASTIPATIYPCATCSGTTLTETCPWVSTIPFSSIGAAPYTSYGSHPAHEAPTPTAGVKTYGCSTCSLTAITATGGVTPTSTPVIFTGTGPQAASGNLVAVFCAVAGGFVAIVALML